MSRDFYEHEYLVRHPLLHEEDVPAKAKIINSILDAHALQDRKIIDFGAGSGAVLRQVSAGAAMAVSMDFSFATLQRNIIERRVQGNVEAIPFRSQSAGVGLCIDLLEHVANPRAALAEMARAAMYVVFKVPLERSYYTTIRGGGRRLMRLRERFGHLHHFARDELIALLEGSFEICDERFMVIPGRGGPTMWLQKLLLRSPGVFGRVFGGFLVVLGRSRHCSAD